MTHDEVYTGKVFAHTGCNVVVILSGVEGQPFETLEYAVFTVVSEQDMRDKVQKVHEARRKLGHNCFYLLTDTYYVRAEIDEIEVTTHLAYDEPTKE